MKSYGETIREGLIKKDMSQQEWADILEVSQKTVSRYIHNEVNVPNDKREIINAVLGIESEICYNRHAAVDAIYNILLSVHSSDRLCILGDVLKKMSSDSVQIWLRGCSVYAYLKEQSCMRNWGINSYTEI